MRDELAGFRALLEQREGTTHQSSLSAQEQVPQFFTRAQNSNHDDGEEEEKEFDEDG